MALREIPRKWWIQARQPRGPMWVLVRILHGPLLGGGKERVLLVRNPGSKQGAILFERDFGEGSN